MPISFAIFCSWQVPERIQVAHLLSCCERISSILTRRASSARGELVRMTMPSRTTLLHEGTSLPSPSTSTQQTRQAEISFSSFK